MQVRLRFFRGTLEVHGIHDTSFQEVGRSQKTQTSLAESTAFANSLSSDLVWDARASCFRAHASAYTEVFLALRAKKTEFPTLEIVDEAKNYQVLELVPTEEREPRPYQAEAIHAFRKAKGRGVVVLPTGAGKTHVAVMAMQWVQRSTLIVAPTLDLVRQWHGLLAKTFDCEVGVIGGGNFDLQPITVTTYDSAHLHMENLGNRFGFLIFDEVHHLPSSVYAMAATLSLAPFRLGLTATPERTDGKDEDLVTLVGPELYRRDIVELAGDFLAEYETIQIPIQLTEDERREYEKERALYRAFLARSGVNLGGPNGFSEFMKVAARTPEGRRAMVAFRRQRELSLCASGKLDYVDELLWEHRMDRTIVFTQDNATCHRIALRALIPAITHQTKVKERAEILGGLSTGLYTAVVTSKVLNEGVDVPDANVAIVVSGTGSVREHVQRLGRILRKKADKYALLYELVTDQTGEGFTSERRREHSAYR